MPVKIFICYAHEDEALLNKLKAHLKPLQHQGLIDVWYDRDISAGTEWKREISQHLNEANIILLLVSPDFIKSDYCYSVEMRRAIERHKQREASVIPIILRWVSWMGTPLGTLQALPKDGKPIKSWQDEDEAFYDVIKGIRKIQASHEDEQRESELSLPQYKPSAPPPVIQKRSLHSTWKKSVLFLLVLLVIVSVVLFSTSYFSNLNYQKRTNSTVTTQTLLTRTALDTVSPSTSPTATPTLCLVRCVLYHADWSKGLVGWMGGSQWSVNSNGILVSNGNDQNIKFLIAPYQPKTANYAVEAQIQFLKPFISSADPTLFGVRLRGGEYADVNGYDFYIYKDTARIRVALDPDAQVLETKPYHLDTRWHTYRIEANNTILTCYIDNVQVLQVSDYNHTQPGLVGLFDINSQINVRNFTVFSL